MGWIEAIAGLVEGGLKARQSTGGNAFVIVFAIVGVFLFGLLVYLLFREG